MKVDLEKIVDEPFDWREVLQIPAKELSQQDLVELGDVQCTGQIRDLTPGYLLQASLSYAQTLRCTRCLELFEDEMTGRMDLVLEVNSTETTDPEVELSQEDLGVLRLQETLLDTEPLLIEQIHLGIPMKPLCKDDCAGICSECGANLNAGSCGCGPKIDPRWAALGKLSEKTRS